jgi:putative transposase
MRFDNSRHIPEGFEIKTVTLRQKADGWFVSVRMETQGIANISVIPNGEIKTITG